MSYKEQQFMLWTFTALFYFSLFHEMPIGIIVFGVIGTITLLSPTTDNNSKKSKI